MIYNVAFIIFEKQKSETKPSYIHLKTGVMAKVCFVYIQVELNWRVLRVICTMNFRDIFLG